MKFEPIFSVENGTEETKSKEPSADELIEVLKNLEQLASKNPALYRAITDQIKVNIWKL